MITFNHEAESLKAMFEQAMEARRAEVMLKNGEVELDMQILENIITNRFVLNDVAMDKQLRWLCLSGDDDQDLKSITTNAIRKGRGDSSSTCLLASAMIQAEREAAFEILDEANQFMRYKAQRSPK